MIRFPPGGEAHAHDVEWNARVVFFLDLAPEWTPSKDRRTTPAKDCWLYIFDQHGIQLAEVFADRKGIYHGVDYAKYGGKDVRPYAESGDGVSAELPLFAGQKSSKTLPADALPGDNFLKYFYWVLPSPFQLPWARFPHITSKGMKNTFQNWADSKRGLSAVFPELDGKTGDPLKTMAIEAPWTHAKALSECFKEAQQRWISRYLQNEEHIHLRTLCSYVRTVEAVVGKARFDKVKNDLLICKHFFEEERTLNEQVEFPMELVKARAALQAYLAGKRMKAMRDDALASPDPRAIGTYGEIKADALDGLDGPGGDPAYGERAKKDDDFVLNLDLPTLEDKVRKFLVQYSPIAPAQFGAEHWKEARKAAKSYWYLVKAYASELSWRSPDKMVVELQWVGRSLFGVFVEYALPKDSPPRILPDGTVKYSNVLVADLPKKTEGYLKSKFLNNPAWKAFYVVLDGLNLAVAVKDRAAGKNDSKAVMSAAGSFLNTSAGAIEATMARKKIEHLFFTQKTTAEDAAKLAGQKGRAAGRSSPGALVRKFNTPKSLGLGGKLLGLFGAACETLSSVEKARKAGAAFDTEAAAVHWASAGANAATSIGYLLGGAGTVAVIITGATMGWPIMLGAIGAALIFGGSATDLGLKLALPSLEHDPLENWLRVSPWGRELKHRLPTFDKQADAFHEALVGLRVTYRQSLASFDVTIETREVNSPGQIFLELQWTSEASARPLVNPMAPLTEANRVAPKIFRHNEFASAPRKVTARVRLLIDGRLYPAAGPQEFKFPK
jgi:hypothetical protein